MIFSMEASPNEHSVGELLTVKAPPRRGPTTEEMPKTAAKRPA